MAEEKKQESLFGESDRVINTLTLEISRLEDEAESGLESMVKKQKELKLLDARLANMKVVKDVFMKTLPGDGAPKAAGK